MNREIKFRAWSEEDKVMIYDLNSLRLFHGVLISDDYIVMQFTGLKDKNGKDIYEGDIVYFQVENQNIWVGPITGEIFFNKDHASFEIKTKKGFLSIARGYDAYRSSLEILGNIYENPEMINDD